MSQTPSRLLALALTLLAGTSLHAATPGSSSLVAERLIFAAPAGDAEDFAAIRAAQTRARRAGATVDDFDRLGWSWIQQARGAHDDGAYQLALATADVIDARFGASPNSLLLRGHALHNLHRFAEAEVMARRLVPERGDPRDYALLADVLLERGQLSEAITATQAFVDRQPGLESYARVAHLRWLRGDTAGALDAMASAVRAGDRRNPEPLAWALTRLAQLHLQANNSAHALAAAEAALACQPGYAPALLARGRALLASGEPAAAQTVLQVAADATSLPEYQWWLADALRATDDSAGAQRVETAIITQGPRIDPRTTALFLATRCIQTDEAVRLATAELAQRADVHTHDAVAWSLFRAGRVAEARTASRAALGEGTRDARLFLHAGLIALADGDNSVGQDLLRQAAKISAALTPGERALLTASLSISATTTEPAS